MLERTVEWQHWGWNALTVSFVATIVFTAFQAWGLWQQDRTIRRRRSGEAVAVLPFAYIGCVFFAVMCYGIAIDSIALMGNGVLGILQARVVIGLVQFKPIARAERIAMACFPAMIVAMIALPWRGTVALVIMMASLVPMLQQPYEIWRRRTAGAVDIRYVAIFLVASTFWMIYGIAIGAWPLIVVNPCAVAILGTTAVLWFRFRPRSSTGSTGAGSA